MNRSVALYRLASRAPRQALSASRAGLYLAAIASVLFAVWLRLGTTSGFLNGDEVIVIRVSDAMAAAGNLDPNWANADLPYFFKHNSYNFYGYEIVLHPIIQAAKMLGVDPLSAARIFNIVLQLGAAACLYFAAYRKGWPPAIQWLAPVLFLFSPGVVQDAHMARPESLTYFLAALAMLVASRVTWPIKSIIFLGAIIGFGMSVKISFATVGALAIPALFSDTSVRGIAIRALVLGASVLLSLIVTEPYAFLNFDVLTSGIQKLSEQYSGAHPPHSLPRYDFLQFGVWVLTFFVFTMGGVFLLGAVSPVVASSRPSDRLLIGSIWLSAAALFAYFATRSVFFERNLAHAIPQTAFLAAYVIGSIPSRQRGAIWAAITIAVPAYWSFQIADISRSRTDLASYEQARDMKDVKRVYFYSPFEEATSCTGVLALQDYGDEFSEAFTVRLKMRGFEEVSVRQSRFSALPVSTLQVYLEQTVRYFKCAPS